MKVSWISVNKKETYSVLKAIVEYYPNFLNLSDSEAVQKRMDMWHRALKDFDIESILDNLAVYALENEFSPKVSNLVKGLTRNVGNVIPDVEETKKIMEKYKTDNPMPVEDVRKLIEEKLGKGWLK